MPKRSISFNIKDWVQTHEFSDIDSAADHIIEYAPDFGFPDETTDISLDKVQFSPDGNSITLVFDYEVEEEEEEDEEDENDDLDVEVEPDED